MDKEEWKSFFRFIDEASEAELEQRKDALAGVLAKVTDPGVRSDIRRMLRLIDEEALINITGNGGDDRVIGSDGGNIFVANGGHDCFDGGAGVDSAHCWFTAVAESNVRVAWLDELVIRVSVDGRQASVTTKVGTAFSLTLVDGEALGVVGADGQRTTVFLSDFITPQFLAEDTIAAGGTMRWNALQPLGTATTLTFSFVTPSAQPGFRPFNAVEQQAARDILARTAAINGLTFTEMPESAGNAGQPRFGINQQAASKGQAAPPGTQGEAAGDVWMDVESMATAPTPGSEAYATLLHEIGHALGLRHPRNTDPGENWPMQLRAQDDRPGLTAMSSQPSADGLFRAAPSIPCRTDCAANPSSERARRAAHPLRPCTRGPILIAPCGPWPFLFARRYPPHTRWRSQS